MAFAGEELDLSASDDDLIEVHARPATNRNDLLDDPFSQRLPHPFTASAGSGASRRPMQREGTSLANMLRQRPHRHLPQPQQGGGTATPVIDLTEEPDSPEQLRPLLPPLAPPSQSQPLAQGQSQSQQSQVGRNPRRTNSLRLATPRLARSDGTFMGREASVVDLTSDPEDERRPQEQQPQHHHHHHHHRPPPGHNNRRYNVRPRPFPDDQLIELEFNNAGQNMHNMVSNIAARFGQRLAGLWGADMIMENFNPQHHHPPPALEHALRNGHRPREPAIPKPPMEPIPATRAGFVRDTCGGEGEDGSEEVERVVICPSCEEELAYDPTGTVVQSAVGGGKKRKRAPGEHHFWALKKCGHVYCADCFENRRPTKANPTGVGFRSATGVLPLSAANDVRCAVESCETKVALKTEWVGIFL